MISISKRFSDDVLGTDINLKPVLVITEQDSIDVLEVFTVDGEFVTTPEHPIEPSAFIPCIQNVSSVKTSIDYEKGKLKVNRLRCNLYNYYDNNTTLVDYYGEGTTSASPILINKDIYLFYKTPSTSRLNLAAITGVSSPTDKDCALMYKGTISRVEYNEKTISVYAEDQTQLKITDKLIPAGGIETLSQPIQDKLFKNYKGEDTTVPMTFGSVNKAFTLPHVSEQSEQAMKIMFDVQPTGGNFRTARIPRMLENTPTEFIQGGSSNNQPYCLYIKKENDYVIWDHSTQSINFQYQLYSQIHVNSLAGSFSTLIAPELSPQTQYVYNLWDVRGYITRYVDQYYYSGDQSKNILDIHEVNVGELSGTATNPIGLNDNGGLPRIFFRSTDFGGNGFNVSAETTHIPRQNSNNKTATNAGVGRYLLLNHLMN